MHILKLLFQERKVQPTLAPRRDRRPPGAHLKPTAWGTARDIRAIVFLGETLSSLPRAKMLRFFLI